MDFSDMGGMWMQTETRAVAEVRIVGRHIFTSKAVSIEAGAVEASKTDQPGHRSFGRGRAVLGTGVLPH